MSKIQDLISKFCPNGVAIKKLVEVCEDFIVPMRDRPKDLTGSIPWCRIEDIEKWSLNGSLSGLGVSEETIKSMNLKVMPTGTVIASCSASLGKYAITSTPLITNQTFIGLVCGHEINNRYLLHILQTKTRELAGVSNSGTIPYISRSKFEQLRIPVPPIEIQLEVVKILDEFIELQEELEAELEAELQARKKQYDHVFRTLLRLDHLESQVRWVPMGEVCLISWGNTSITKSSFVSQTESYLAYSAAGPDGRLAHYEFDREAVILSAIGARCGKTYFATGKWTSIKNTIYIYSKEQALLNKYLYWYTNREDFWPRSSSAQPFITMGDIKNLVIPIPDLGTQQRIIRILDALEEVMKESSIALTAEIQSRRKQYEYYRNNILSFQEIATV